MAFLYLERIILKCCGHYLVFILKARNIYTSSMACIACISRAHAHGYSYQIIHALNYQNTCIVYKHENIPIKLGKPQFQFEGIIKYGEGFRNFLVTLHVCTIFYSTIFHAQSINIQAYYHEIHKIWLEVPLKASRGASSIHFIDFYHLMP